MRRLKGFTLVELLVVIGIIALLISILLPSLGKAQEAAKSIRCSSNMRNLAQGLAIYMSGKDAMYPLDRFTRDRGSADAVSIYWYQVALNRQPDSPRKAIEIMRCPNDPNTAFYDGNVSYGYNYMALGGWDRLNEEVMKEVPSTIPNGGSADFGLGPDRLDNTADDKYARKNWPEMKVGARAGRIKKPSETVLATETAINNPIVTGSTSLFNGQGWYRIRPWSDPYNGAPYYRHGKTCNVVFVDSHVEGIQVKKNDWRTLFEDDRLGNMYSTVVNKNKWDRK